MPTRVALWLIDRVSCISVLFVLFFQSSRKKARYTTNPSTMALSLHLSRLVHCAGKLLFLFTFHFVRVQTFFKFYFFNFLKSFFHFKKKNHFFSRFCLQLQKLLTNELKAAFVQSALRLRRAEAQRQQIADNSRNGF